MEPLQIFHGQKRDLLTLVDTKETALTLVHNSYLWTLLSHIYFRIPQGKFIGGSAKHIGNPLSSQHLKIQQFY